MKLKLCRNIHNSSCFRCYDNLKFPFTCNWKSESRPLLLSHCRVLQRCSLSNPLTNIWILSKPLHLIGCHGNRKDKFAKKYSKLISPEAIMGVQLKLCRNLHNISRYKTCLLLLLLMCFRCYGNLKFPLTYNEKSESRSLLLSHCRYFDRTFFL